MYRNLFKIALGGVLLTTFITCKLQDDDNCAVAEGKLIDRISTTSFGHTTTEIFVYNAKNQIDSIVKEVDNFLFYAFKYNEKNQLVERQMFTNYKNNLRKARVDSLTYDVQNRLINVRQYDSNEKDSLVFSNIKVFSYNSQGKIDEEVTSYVNFQSSRIYEWDNDNVVRITDYDGNKTKLHLFSFKYDDKKNPFLTTVYTYDEVQSRNNIVESSVIDFSGRLDLIANPITRKYRYNSSNFPTLETNNAESKKVICYK